MAANHTTFTLATSPNPGAVAMVQIHGPGAAAVLQGLTGRGDWPPGCLRLVDLGGIDQGLAVLLRDDWVQLMPHGGPLVVQQLSRRLVELGATPLAQPAALAIYPEARCPLEADMLLALAHAASPAAIDLLLAQVQLWSDYLAQAPAGRQQAEEILARSRSLQRLIQPPSVAVVGPPNVGKSTLANRMLGRAASLVADLPGTTRDWVCALAQIRGVALTWLDTPGLRQSADPIEQAAIELARAATTSADLLLAVRDPASAWPAVGPGNEQLPRQADLFLLSKSDTLTPTQRRELAPPAAASAHIRPGAGPELPLPISSVSGENLDELETIILERLGLADLPADQLWAFSPALQALLAEPGDGVNRALTHYLRENA